MMSEEIITPLQDCNVHVALMGSEFDVQGMYMSTDYTINNIQ